MVRHALLWSMVAALGASACGPPPAAATPRPTGVDSRAFIGESELVIRYRYVPLPRFEIELWVDLHAQGGEAGEIEVKVEPADFDVTRGPLTFSKTVGADGTESGSVRLRASGSPAPRVVITTTRVEGRVELARDTLHFFVDEAEDLVRECRPTDAACK